MTKSVAAKSCRAGRALIEIAEAEGIQITRENVYPGSIYTHKIIKAYHHVEFSDDILKVKRPSILEPFANVDEKALKTAKDTTLEGTDWIETINHPTGTAKVMRSQGAVQGVREVINQVSLFTHGHKPNDFLYVEKHNELKRLLLWLY
ncbi:hypothetical protein [Lysinibacillus xylanilyticus]|uniref:hypothetical protein n=1 Tax=Lysinibacillus xylanilyticus TaxID=582475 RepID=UPI003D0436FE